MSEILKKQFDAGAENYDIQRRHLIPCFDDFYGIATDWVNCENDAPRILDLGAGTGLFSSYVLHKYPNAAITLIDLSDEMLKQARTRFADKPSFDYILANYVNYSYTGKYDAVISSLSIHHLPHPAKRELFRVIHDLLIDGGVFVNADQAAGTSVFFEQANMQQWEDSVRRTDLSTKNIEASMERRKLDINATAEEQLNWLREAGFVEADCIYKNYAFAVFAAIKKKSHS